MGKLIRGFLTLICIVCFCVSFYKVYNYYLENKQSGHVFEDFSEGSVVNIEEDTGEEVPTEDIPAEIKEPPISVDFDKLRKKNEDVIAWIYSDGTQINYPVMKSRDNEDYLHHLPDGTYNITGTPFLDFRNSADFTDFTSIIYGHHMKNGSMFASISEYKADKYYKKHPVMYLLTPECNYRVEIFSGYITPSDSSSYTMPVTEEKKESFLQTAAKESTFKADVNVSADDRVLILSTCSYEYNGARYVLLGKLVEIK